MLKDDPLYKALTMLRSDALERGMSDLAIVYGWSLLRRGDEIIGQMMTGMERYLK